MLSSPRPFPLLGQTKLTVFNILFHTFFSWNFSVSPAIGDLAYQTYATVPSAHVADVKQELRDGSLLAPQRVHDPHPSTRQTPH